MATFDFVILPEHVDGPPAVAGVSTAGVWEMVLLEEQAFFETIYVSLDGLVAPATFDLLIYRTPADLNHCDTGKARLLEQFRGKDKIEALICLIGDIIQEVEQSTADIIFYGDLARAFGNGLDLIGQTLYLPRNDLTDTVYRARLSAQASVIGSMGHVNDLLDVLTALDDGFTVGQGGDLTITEYFPAGALAHCLTNTQSIGETFALFLKRATPAGVRLILEFEYEASIDLLAWEMTADDDGIGGDLSEDGTDGGTMAEAV